MSPNSCLGLKQRNYVKILNIVCFFIKTYYLNYIRSASFCMIWTMRCRCESERKFRGFGSWVKAVLWYGFVYSLRYGGIWGSKALTWSHLQSFVVVLCVSIRLSCFVFTFIVGGLLYRKSFDISFVSYTLLFMLCDIRINPSVFVSTRCMFVLAHIFCLWFFILLWFGVLHFCLWYFVSVWMFWFLLGLYRFYYVISYWFYWCCLW